MSQSRQAVSRVVRAATWNVQHGHPDPAALGRACAELDVAVLALQEVDRRTRRIAGRDLLADVAADTGLVPVDGQVVDFDGGTYGNALLVRADLLERPPERPFVGLHRPRWPPWRRPEPRGAVVAQLASGVTVVGAHLGLRRSERRKQIPGLLRAAGPGRAVVLGDLNAFPDEVRPHAGRHGFELLDVPPAFPATWPRRAIDHVLVRGVVGRPCPGADRPVVSDHRPILVELELLEL